LIAYLDTSVVLRVVLGSPEPLNEWPSLERGVSSALMRVECYRALERLWRSGELGTDELTAKRVHVEAILDNVQMLPLGDDVLRLAADPMPTHLNTLDALHLASALLYRRSSDSALRHVVFATHDKLLAKAARELHFDVIGA
jgi:predicted nucleic acid-binding protein